MTSGADEEWVKAAMSDDTMVVELLVRLHGAAVRTPPAAAVALPLEWTVRQRRSKPLPSVANNQKNQAAQRASPTTPLSWSGATSISGGSGGAGGEESSSRPLPQKLSSGTRSKVGGDAEKTTLKRSRKKKTLAELQVEETSLQKEKRELKREIDAVRVNLAKERATNENLKRMKVELQTLPGRETLMAEESTSDQMKNKMATCDPAPSTIPVNVLCNDTTQQSSSPTSCPDPDGGFMLPDLNIPFEENPCPDVIWSRLNA